MIIKVILYYVVLNRDFISDWQHFCVSPALLPANLQLKHTHYETTSDNHAGS